MKLWLRGFRGAGVGRVAVPLTLAGILGVSLVLRLWGSRFGLPAYTRYHPDEHALVSRAAAILWTGDWKLERFNYPPFYAYVQVLAYAAYFLWGAAHGYWNSVPEFPLPQYYHVGRLVTALAGVATVVVVYKVGRQMFGRRAGLGAAVLLGGSYLHIIHSHYATFDVMVGLLVALTLLFSVFITLGRQPRWYLLAGVCAGLAGATKYNGAVALVIPVVAHMLITTWDEWGWLDGRLFAAAGGFLVGFLGGNPFALGDLTGFLNGLAQVLHHYGGEQPGFEGRGNWRWYIQAFATSADALWVFAGAVGLVGVIRREWKKGLLLLSFPLVYYAMISSFAVRFERNAVPILPFLAVGAGWLVDVSADRLAKAIVRYRRGEVRSRTWSHGIAALGCILLVGPSLGAATSLDMLLSRVDHRELAGQWFEENIQPGTKVGIEHYSIPFRYDLYRVEDVLRVTDHDLDWYLREGFQVLVISDGVWPILHEQPHRYHDRLEVYQALVKGSTLLAESVPDPPDLVVAGYPTVAVYHFAPVRILRLPGGE